MADFDIPPQLLCDPWFVKCLLCAARSPEFVSNFDKLTGFNLSGTGAPIERLIDEASGFQDKGVRAFVRAVYDVIYLRVEAPHGIEGEMTPSSEERR
jgi:hypothetical protein